MDAVVRDALLRAVQDLGPGLADRPSQVRAVLTDLLGPQTQALRGQLDAVVIGAEEAIPAGVRAGRPVDELTWRLQQRGLDEGSSRAVIDLWAQAVGWQPTAPPPPETAGPVAFDPTIVEPHHPGPHHPGPHHPGLPHPVPHHPGADEGTVVRPEPGPEHTDTARRPLWRHPAMLAGVAALAVAAIVLTVFLVGRRGDDPLPTAGGGSRSGTTTTAGTTTTSPVTTPPRKPLGQVTGLMVDNSTWGELRFAWTPVDGAAGYRFCQDDKCVALPAGSGYVHKPGDANAHTFTLYATRGEESGAPALLSAAAKPAVQARTELSAADRAIINRTSSALINKNGCGPAATLPGMSGIDCAPAKADILWPQRIRILQFPDRASMDAFYHYETRGIDPKDPTPGCNYKDSWHYESTPNRPEGDLGCYLVGEMTVMVWSDVKTNTLYFAIRAGRDGKALSDWWTVSEWP